MRQRITRQPALVHRIPIDGLADAHAWLQTKALDYRLTWLLAHADDGVIWGKSDDGRLITSYDAAQGNAEARKVCPPLRLETLQQARLFVKQAELLLWRGGNNSWHARLIGDVKDGDTAEWQDTIDEPQILWGTDPEPLDHGFTLIRDGAQGLRHAVPLEVTGHFTEQSRPLRLEVRHYLKDDPTGFTRIVASRLVTLRQEGTQ